MAMPAACQESRPLKKELRHRLPASRLTPIMCSGYIDI